MRAPTLALALCALVLAGCCSSVRAYEDAEWERARAAAEAVVEARGGYDVELAADDEGFLATWRQELPALIGVVSALVLTEPCDRWFRLELSREERGVEAAARVVYVDFVLFVVPTFGTEDQAEERLLEAFELEHARRTAEPAEAR